MGAHLVFAFFINFNSVPSLAAKLSRNFLRILDLVLISSDLILSVIIFCSLLLNDVSMEEAEMVEQRLQKVNIVTSIYNEKG